MMNIVYYIFIAAILFLIAWIINELVDKTLKKQKQLAETYKDLYNKSQETVLSYKRQVKILSYELGEREESAETLARVVNELTDKLNRKYYEGYQSGFKEGRLAYIKELGKALTEDHEPLQVQSVSPQSSENFEKLVKKNTSEGIKEEGG